MESKEKDQEKEDYKTWPYEGMCGKCGQYNSLLSSDLLCKSCIAAGITASGPIPKKLYESVRFRFKNYDEEILRLKEENDKMKGLIKEAFEAGEEWGIDKTCIELGQPRIGIIIPNWEEWSKNNNICGQD